MGNHYREVNPCAPAISPKEREEFLDFLERFRLAEHDPGLAVLLQSIDFESPSHLDLQTWELFKGKVSNFQAYHHQFPFISVPNGHFNHGCVSVAYLHSTKHPIKRNLDLFTGHIVISGATNSGKTSFSQNLLQQLIPIDALHMMVFDPKDDYRFLAYHDPDCLIITPESLFNLMQKPSYLSLNDHIFLFINCFRKTFYGAELVTQVLHEALNKAYSQKTHPTIHDLIEIVDSLYTKSDTYARRDAIRGTVLRLKRFSADFPGPSRSPGGISMDELWNHSICIPVKNISSETHKFIFTYLVQSLFLRNRHRNIRDGLTHVVYTDEGHETWSMDQANIDRVPLLSSFQSQFREFSIGFFITTTCFSKLHDLVRSNTNCFICLTQTNHKDVAAISQTFNLSKEQLEFLNVKMTKGQAIVKFSETWRDPILATFPPLLIPKDLPTSEWSAAVERINKYAPLALPPAILVEPEQEKPIVEEQEPKHEKPARNQLNTNEKQLLKASAKRIQTSMDAYQTADLHPDQGNRCKKKLIALGFLVEKKILIKPGRGGLAKVLLPTQKALECFNLKQEKSSRGGDGPQHRYLSETISSLIPKAEIEFSINEKSVDVFFIYLEKEHKEFVSALKDSIFFYIEDKGAKHSNFFHIEEKASRGLTNSPFQEGELIALEVECSDIRKTALSNIKKNHAVGISWTVFGVLPKEVDRLKTLLKNETTPGICAVDVLKFLEGLRAAYGKNNE
ncbi:MAG TPA: DUF87 domain-containing protein [Thermoanaerobaculia bacterium]|mgnify:CR=1 FL=1|nr:DUF87 domain-containing protein [Thermoanaerobaculia bacterium]HUM29586.1 DUF87 domain-containing protein [Thermoanaerobaculia bacterium]HXK67237.1 DUF87 domain-containing protein [Thermoanaerobaculia bacterium]